MSASRRAGSSRASCRSRRPRSVTPCRSRTMASNFKSWPTLATDSSSRTALSSASASSTRTERRRFIARSLDPNRLSLAPDRRWTNGTYRACRGPVDNARPAIPARIADGASGSTRSPKRPAARQRLSQLAHLLDRGRRAVVLADRLGVRRVFHDERAESEPREELEAALARRAAVAQSLRRRIRPERRCGFAPARGSAAHRPHGASNPSRYRLFVTSAACASSCVERRRTARSRSRAPFSPMPGTPLMLSMESPISARTSTTCDGATPNFSFTPSASYHVPSSRGL